MAGEDDIGTQTKSIVVYSKQGIIWKPKYTNPFLMSKTNEPLGAKGPLLVGEEVRKEVGKVRSWKFSTFNKM
jgi:hypothetical protein